MTTVAILKQELKKAGIVPKSGLKKADLETLLAKTKKKNTPVRLFQLRPELSQAQLEMDAYQLSIEFLELLRAKNLNVVTAESLTAGMIIKTLIDVPTYGNYIYGGYSVYDSDAKRTMLGVKVGDVYTPRCAKEMAEGALKYSRAMVAIAVTGHAGPVNNSADLGHVDIGCSVRFSNGKFFTKTHHLNSCINKLVSSYCKGFIKEKEMDYGGCKDLGFSCSSLETISRTRDHIRLLTVCEALKLAIETITDAGNISGDLPKTKYDGKYTSFGEPSSVIKAHLEN